MRKKTAILLVASLAIYSCDFKPSHGSVVTPTPAPTIATPAPTPGVQIIGSSGGAVTLPNVAELQFAAGAFSINTAVAVKAIDRAILTDALSTDDALFAVKQYVSTAVDVQIDGTQPANNTAVTLTVPTSAITARPAGTGVRVFIASENEGEGGEQRPYYELVVPTSEVAGDSTRLKFNAEPSHFAQRRGSGFMTTIVVGFAPGP